MRDILEKNIVSKSCIQEQKKIYHLYKHLLYLLSSKWSLYYLNERSLAFGLYVINDKNRNKDKKIKVIERISLSGEVITLEDLEDFLTI